MLVRFRESLIGLEPGQSITVHVEDTDPWGLLSNVYYAVRHFLQATQLHYLSMEVLDERRSDIGGFSSLAVPSLVRITKREYPS